MTPPPPIAPPMYVGYRPLPPGLRRPLARFLAALCSGMLLTAIAVAAAQRDPGPAVWSPARQRFSGVLLFTPYPVLFAHDRATPPRLLVAQGKFGLAIDAALDGTAIAVEGTLLRRGRVQMVEVAHFAPDPSAPSSPLPRLESSGRVSLRGEIVDSKCHLGAMKPGDGTTHRACATLCLRGGVPPVLVSADERGRALYTLLTDDAGGPANQLVLPFVAEPVEVSGTLTVRGDVRMLAIQRITRR